VDAAIVNVATMPRNLRLVFMSIGYSSCHGGSWRSLGS
jgi:hypothetical protein